MFSSFGYFPTETQNKSALKQMINCLKQNDNFFMSTINKDWILKNFKENDWSENKDYFILAKRELDSKKKYVLNDWTFITKSEKKILRYPHKVRIYGKNELVQLFKQCGLSRIKVFGDFKGNKFQKTISRNIIITGQKI